ncbi:MAG: nucleoside monophosphate kinase [Holophagales bacterium]|jgi:adenylate kinase|nr:nucleoside monophosphate kinase [Holophagales bacterium]
MKAHILPGAPASGKGTPAKLIEEKFALTHISTGDILRDSVSKETEICNAVSKFVEDYA